MPERLGIEYTAADGEKKRPVMLHRALLGSMERFIGILIENYGGALPVWLAPVQCRVLPISENFSEYAKNIYNTLIDAGIRAEIDERNEKVGYKIREAETKKVPFMLIAGEKEQSAGTVSIRQHTRGDVGVKPLQEFIDGVLKLAVPGINTISL